MTELHAPERPPATRPEVAISVPTSSVYLSVVRTAAAGVAARLDFTLDDIEDLRIAVDEACAILIAHARPDSMLDCRFDLLVGAVVVTGSVRTDSTRPPAREGFSWTVLSALATQVQIDVQPDADGHRLSLSLTRTSERVEPQ